MQVDPRGQRFGATITTVVLIVVLTTGSWVLLAAQALVFAVGAIFGLRHAPPGGNKHLAGTIVRAALYDTALSPTEVAALAAHQGWYCASRLSFASRSSARRPAFAPSISASATARLIATTGDPVMAISAS